MAYQEMGIYQIKSRKLWTAHTLRLLFPREIMAVLKANQVAGTIDEASKLTTHDDYVRQVYSEIEANGFFVRGPGKRVTAKKRSDNELTVPLSRDSIGLMRLKLGQCGYRLDQ